MQYPADVSARNIRHPFLEGGGELGKLIRTFNWSKTPLGTPDSWPQSLKTSVSICINTDFPMLVCWGPQWIMIYNDAYIPVLGSKHPHALGSALLDCWQEIRDMLHPMFKGVVDNCKAIFAEDLMFPLSRYGYTEECYFTFSYSPIKDETGNVGGVLVTCTETTDRVISERRLKTLKRFADEAAETKTLDEAFNVIRQTLSGNDCDFPYALYYHLDESNNKAYLKTAIRSGRNKIPAEINLLEPKKGRTDFSSLKQLGKPELIQHPFEYKNFTGGAWPEKPTSHYLIPVRRPERDLLFGFLVLGISPRKQFDQPYRDFFQLVADQAATAMANAVAFESERKRIESLTELNKAKTVFFSNISHEFRTPLTLMLCPLEELISNKNISSSVQESLLVTHRNALRMQKLVNNLLDFSRIEAGKINATYEPVNLSSFTIDLASTFRSAIEKEGIQFVVDCSLLSKEVWIDRDMWEKVVINLLSNAYKYTFKGQILVRLRESEGLINLIVKDTGVGIPDSDLEKIFERFHRVEPVMGRTLEGTGIGLSLVKELVKLHDGSISVESKLNEGTQFTVRLPFKNSRVQGVSQISRKGDTERIPRSFEYEIPIHQSHFDKKSSPTNVGKKYILIADDNADMRYYIARILSKQYEVVTVADGKAALSIMRERQPDLVVADIMMPKMGGFEMLEAIKVDPSLGAIPVILVSARAGDEAISEGLEKGADAYLVKPFTAQQLCSLVQSRLLIHESQLKIFESEKQFKKILLKAPSIFLILKGYPEMIIEFANEALFRSWGRNSDIIGKPLLDVLPEIRDQPFPKLLENVFKTGTPYYSGEEKAILIKQGVPVETYYKYVYQPILDDDNDDDNTVTGITVLATDITEQVLARKRIEKREKDFSELVNKSPMSIMIIGATDLRIELVNEKFLILSGMKEEQVVGKVMPEVFPVMKKQGLEQEMKKVIKTGEAFHHLEFEVDMTPYGGGSKHYFDLVYQPLKDDSGKVTRIMVISHEVTEQVNARKRTEQNEQQLQQFFQQAPVSINVFRGKNFIVDVCNDISLEMWGKTRDEVIGKPFFEIFPELIDSSYETLLRPYTTGIPYEGREFPAEFVRKGKLYRGYFDFITQPIKENNGNIVGVFSVGTEVTDKVLARQKIEESEQRLRLATETTGAGIFDFNVNSNELYWSDQMKLLCGYNSEQQITAETAAVVVYPGDREQLLTAYRSILTKGKDNLICEFRIVRQNDGQLRWLHVRANTYFDKASPIRISGIAIDITAQKHAEEKVRQSELQLQLITDALPALISYVDKEERYQFNNRSYRQWFGLTIDQIKGLTLRDILGKQAYETIRPWVEKVLKGEPVVFESRIPYKDGGERYVLGTYIPHVGNDGEVLGFYALVNDITNLKLAEEKIKESEEKNRLFIEHAPAAMAMFDREMRYIAVSRQWLKEYDLEDGIIGQKHYDLFPNILPRWKDVHRRCLAGAVEKSDEDFYVKDNGTPVWLKWDVHPWYTASREIGGIVIFTENITERKKSESIESQLSAIVESSGDAIYSYDFEGVILSWNKSAEALYGYSADEIIGKKISMVIPPERQEEAEKKIIPEIKKGGIIQNYETFRMRRDGTVFHALLTASPIRDKEGKPMALSIIIRDITERKQVEKKLIRSEDKYRQLARSLEQQVKERTRDLQNQMEELKQLHISEKQKDDFIKMASHELKTPVTSIKGYVQLLMSMAEPEEKGNPGLSFSTMKNSLSIIDKQVSKLTRLLGELLDLSRIETGMLELKLEKFNLNELVIETVQEVLYTHSKHKIEIENDDVLEVVADRDRIAQVLINLIINATKYSPHCDRIVVRIFKDANLAAVSVKDFGIGICQEDRNKIFDRFYRAEGEYEKTFPGFGIGLYIAREIVHRHTGKIWVESEKGKGALFIFNLPIEPSKT